MLKICQIQDLPAGITKVSGRCKNLTKEELDLETEGVAYRLDETAQLSISTAHAFPNGFPKDFSILLVAKPSPGKKNTLNNRISENFIG